MRNLFRGIKTTPTMVEQKKGMRPVAMLPVGFFAIIAIGTVLLLLPVSSVGRPLSFVEALFTATSGVCVTGLTLIDPGSMLTTFGQVVLIVLIQLGGLGFMTVATMLFMFVGKKVSLHERMTIAESFGQSRLQGVLKLSINAVKLTLLIEVLGVLLLSFRFIPMYGAAKGIWASIFTSISAFCNAGFDIFGTDSSMISFAREPYVLCVVMLLIVLGGLGFAVLGETLLHRWKKRLSLHAKIVLSTTLILIVAGALLVYAMEADNPRTFGELPFGDKVASSFFQSITARTAGFDGIGQASLTQSSKILTLVLMFIGASPAGTGGGVKTVTIAILIMQSLAIIRNKQSLNLFGRKISDEFVRRAFCVFLLAVGFVLLLTLSISAIEARYGAGELNSLDITFEVVSAMSTTGLSLGITRVLTDASKLLLCLAMFGGRVGLLTLAVVLGGRKKELAIIKYPAEDILVG